MAPSRYSAEILIDDRGNFAERRVLENAFAFFKKSPTARGLARRFRRLPPVTVSFSTAPSTEGAAYMDDGPPRVLIQESLFASTGTLVEVLAHELYGHALHIREGRAAGADVSLVMEDEGVALAVGRVVALESGAGVHDDERMDWLAESTATFYLETLFTENFTDTHLSLEEARAPGAALRARMAEYERRRRATASLENSVEIWNFQLDHMEKAHGLDPDSVVGLRHNLDVQTSTVIPQHQALLDEVEPGLKKDLALIEEPEGISWAARLVALSTQPYTTAFEAEWLELARRSAELEARLPKAPEEPALPAPVERLNWGELAALIQKDQEENPDHWTDEPSPLERVPWIIGKQ